MVRKTILLRRNWTLPRCRPRPLVEPRHRAPSRRTQTTYFVTRWTSRTTWVRRSRWALWWGAQLGRTAEAPGHRGRPCRWSVRWRRDPGSIRVTLQRSAVEFYSREVQEIQFAAPPPWNR